MFSTVEFRIDSKRRLEERRFAGGISAIVVRQGSRRENRSRPFAYSAKETRGTDEGRVSEGSVVRTFGPIRRKKELPSCA
jgi:hypothetical protein